MNDVTLPRRKLMIGMTGNVGGGAPAINALTETIDSCIAGGSLVDIQNELGSRGVVSSAPMPTYAYMRKGDFYHAMRTEDLINDWAIGALWD